MDAEHSWWPAVDQARGRIADAWKTGFTDAAPMTPGSPGVIRRLKHGGSVDDASLWLAGVDRPLRLIGRTRSALREQGLHVRSAMRTVVDASGQRHRALCWKLGPDRTRVVA